MTTLTDEDVAGIRARADAATSGDWDFDTVRSEGSYGSGPDTSEDFNAYQLLATVRGKTVSIADSLNSEESEVCVEDDSAWDEIARKNFTFLAHAKTDIKKLLDWRDDMLPLIEDMEPYGKGVILDGKKHYVGERALAAMEREIAKRVSAALRTLREEVIEECAGFSALREVVDTVIFNIENNGAGVYTVGDVHTQIKFAMCENSIILRALKKEA
jgi:hypothetical protein